ncbi:MAG: DNA polymerase I [Defluviitaleaceae bacterium]|nr:DNA polymerase I [Defluviitaleaceae bacterium]
MKILLFDGFSILNRAFYALPPLTNSAGEYTNAVFGFMNIFFRFMDEEKPEFVVVAFDLPQPTFRHEMYGAYKGTRKGMPDELRAQVPTLKGLLEKMGVTLAACAGYEADDVLGTLSAKAVAKGFLPVIITGDRDMLQLASDKIKIRLPKTKAGKTEVEDYNAVQVIEKYGVSPGAFVDVKALMGDTSDNIPGVPGIGEVTATKIIAEYGSLENAIAHVNEIKPKKASSNLAEFREQAILSRALAKIALDAPVELELPAHSQVENFNNDNAREEVKRLELKSLYKRFGCTGSTGPTLEVCQATETPAIPKKLEIEIIKTRERAREVFTQLTETGATSAAGAVFFPLWDNSGAAGATGAAGAAGTGAANPFLVGVAIASPNLPVRYIHIGGEITLLTPRQSFTLQNFDTPLGKGVTPPSQANNLIGGVIGGAGGDLTQAELLSIAKPWLESDSPKWVYDAKSEIGHLRRHEIFVKNITFDAMLASYVLDALAPNSTPTDIAETYLRETTPTLEQILDNKGKRAKDRRCAADLPENIAADFAAHAADIILRARPIMEEKLSAANQTELFRNIELPLAHVLSDMEAVGIRVDGFLLKTFGEKLELHLNALTTQIYELAGIEFNINSPAQLGEILFTKLGLKGGKKTTTGYSTAADVLEKLKNKHAIVPLILEYRAHSKLKSTYTDGMLPLINVKTSRIHSTFHQALTATGRLSSAEPNLQNIPVRTPHGRELRKSFVPCEGWVFIDADYSQIELRLLAHMSGDEILIEAFRKNMDIHRLTASQVLGIPLEEVTPEQRSNAKAVNFGIVYGISAFGLSEDLKIPVKEAEAYIKGYFAKYPGVKKYLDKTISAAKKDGYASTLYNRRRALPELKSSNFNQRAFGERVAMNMPIQGTAADIIKIAMLNVSSRLKNENLRTRLILQVHDELLLESPNEEADRVKHILKEEMENVACLAIPLAADVTAGESWYATK